MTSKSKIIDLTASGLDDMTEEELAFVLQDLPEPKESKETSTESSKEVIEVKEPRRSQRKASELNFNEKKAPKQLVLIDEEEKEQEKEKEKEKEKRKTSETKPIVENQLSECPLCQRFFPIEKVEAHAGTCGIEVEPERGGEGRDGGSGRGREDYVQREEIRNEAPLNCDLCHTEHPAWKVHMLDNCNHKCGIDCLSGHVEAITKLKNHNFEESTCTCPVPGCGKDVSWRDLRTLVSPDVYCPLSLGLYRQLAELFMGPNQSVPGSKRSSLEELRNALERLQKATGQAAEASEGTHVSSPPTKKHKGKSSGNSRSAWTKGTGYGGSEGRVDQSRVDKASKEEQKRDQAIEAELTSVERALNGYSEAGYVDSSGALYDLACQGLLFKSVLGKVLMEYLRNDSLHDIATSRASLYKELFTLMRTLAMNPLYFHLLDDHDKIKLEFERIQRKEESAAKVAATKPAGNSKKRSAPSAVETTTESQQEDETNSACEILALLRKQKVQADVFVNSMSKNESLQSDEGNTETLAIGLEFRDLFSMVDNALKQWSSATSKAPKAGADKDKNPIDVEKKTYVPRMQELQFKMVDINKKTHAYAKQISQNGGQMGARERLKRLHIEIPSLSTSLPLSFDSGIHLRVDEDRPDVMKVMIIGSEGTPYHNGCFIFDIFVPEAYPNLPPMVLLTTTGNGSVRFNPNLYNCGKVCLSLLGTWQGPGWDPKLSTLLQVFMSIQSLILVPDPYYNEPGFENRKENKQSAQYNNCLRYHSIRVAMSDMLKKPVAEFQDVIEAHFAGKKHSIIQQCEEWLNEARDLCKTGGGGYVQHLHGHTPISYEHFQEAVQNFKALLNKRFP